MPDNLCPRCQFLMREGRCANCEMLDQIKALHALPPPGSVRGARDTLKELVFGLWVTPSPPSMMAMSWAKEASQEILGSRWHRLPADMQAALLLTLLAPFEAAFFRTSGLTNGTAVACFPQIYLDLLRQRFASEVSAMDMEVLAGRVTQTAAEVGSRLFNDILGEVVGQVEAVFAEAQQALTFVPVNLEAPLAPDAPMDNVRQLFPSPLKP